MKSVVAYIQNHRLSDVTLALHMLKGISGMTVVDCKGFGRPGDGSGHEDTSDDVADFASNVKIEIVCSDAAADDVAETIRSKAHTGLRGDGMICVSGLQEVIRISTGETGNAAV